MATNFSMVAQAPISSHGYNLLSLENRKNHYLTVLEIMVDVREAHSLKKNQKDS
jgi:hypothetical protein